jgi:hypothetical protein
MKANSHISTFFGSNSSVSSENTLISPPKDELIPQGKQKDGMQD